MNAFSFQCLLLNLFLSFSWIETDDLWELPLDRKNGQSRGRGEIGHSQLYTRLAQWQDILKALRQRHGPEFLCLMKLPRKSSCLLLPCPSASGPAYFWPQALPTFTQPHHGKLQASAPECKGLSLPSGSLSRDAHKWAQFQAWRGCCRRPGPWLGRGWWQTLPQRNVSLQMPLVGFLTHPLPYSRSLQ